MQGLTKKPANLKNISPIGISKIVAQHATPKVPNIKANGSLINAHAKPANSAPVILNPTPMMLNITANNKIKSNISISSFLMINNIVAAYLGKYATTNVK